MTMEAEENRKIAGALFVQELQKLLGQGISVILKTKGSSMLPFIRGSRDRVRLVKPDNLFVGDIVLANFPDETHVLHRIVAFLDAGDNWISDFQNGCTVVLMGDGNLRKQERCKADDILGKVVSIVRPSGKELRCDNLLMSFAAFSWRTWMKPFRRLILAVLRRIVHSE